MGDRVLNKNQYNTTLTKIQDKLYVSPSRLGSLSSQKYGIITYGNIYWCHMKGLTGFWTRGRGVEIIRIVTSWQLGLACITLWSNFVHDFGWKFSNMSNTPWSQNLPIVMNWKKNNNKKHFLLGLSLSDCYTGIKSFLFCLMETTRWSMKSL